LLPFFVLIAVGFFGVLFRSMGMDIHWTSKVALYSAVGCSILTLCACVIAGLLLRRNKFEFGVFGR
jgi:hypothetical protein